MYFDEINYLMLSVLQSVLCGSFLDTPNLTLCQKKTRLVMYVYLRQLLGQEKSLGPLSLEIPMGMIFVHRKSQY